MTEIKASMVILIEFFSSFGQKVIDYNVKLSVKGQIEYATGTLSITETFDPDTIEKAFRKRLVAKDYRFSNSELSFRDNQFIITSR